MGAVAVLVPNINLIIIGNKIPAVHIINIAVAVIVNAITRNLVLINPDGVFQIRVRGVNSGIYDSNGNGALVFCLLIELPGFFNVDIDPSYGVCPDSVIVAGAKRGQGNAVDAVFTVVYIDMIESTDIQFPLRSLKVSCVAQGPLIFGIFVSL